MTIITDRRKLISGIGGVGLVALVAPRLAFAAPTSGFTHGVASGDPGESEVSLWTRHVAPGETRLRVEVAEDEAFQRIVSSGETAALPDSDFSAHARVVGLSPGRWYFYRFTSPTGEMTPTGRTRTLPAGRVDHFRMAVFSCSNGTSGWFNAYAHAAQRDDIDLAVHLGDYIYESPLTRSDAAPGLAQQRGLAPDNELLALTDYRQRYASYRNDPDLLELHRRLPMIAIWDDHETANNSWKDGAAAHDPATEGEWRLRKAAGVRAWREWLPMSDRWYDAYAIGDLATLFRIETRLLGRSEQLDDELGAVLAAGGADLPARLKAFATGPLADPNRSMMGPGQERWLDDGLRASVAQGVRWQILAQQVIVGATQFPKTSAAWFAPGADLTEKDKANLAGREMLTKAGLPYSLDKWDGYPAARQRLYDSARAAKANLVTLSGDSHNAWAFDLGDKAGAVGVEFAGQSVSSFGAEKRFTGDAKAVAAAFVAQNPDLKWMDSSQRGYFTLDITRERVEADYVFVPAKGGRTAAAAGHQTIHSAHGSRKLSV